MIDVNEITKWWNIFVGEGNFTEVRILGRFAYSGYFKSLENLISQLQLFSEMDDEQIYFVLNKIDEGCYGRSQCERFLKSPKTTTSDNNIIRRDWVLIDFDPKRAAGTNASDAEFELAHAKAQVVYTFLREQGFAEPVICKSGNGWHLLLKCNLSNTEENKDIINRFLQAISMLFSDDKVDIDESVFNAARICKLYGTMAKKGANIADRPWRMSQIIYTPQVIMENDLSLFQTVADMVPKEEPMVHYNRGGEQFDLQDFLNRHGIAHKKESCAKWDKYVLDHCIFNPEHSGKDACIIQMASGAIKYVCLHNTCQHHTWQEVRQMYEPEAYMPKPQPQYQTYPQRQPIQQPKNVVKPETPELGKKWLCMKDIKKVDITQLDGVKTGFTALDRRIVKLFYSELTILSGNNASGKSSFLNTLLLNVIDQGVEAALLTIELPAEHINAWIQMAAAGKRNLYKSSYAEDKYYVPNGVADRINEWTDGKLFIHNNDYGSDWNQILSDMKELIEQGVKFFVIDNLFSIDLDDLEGDKNKKEKQFILQLKDLCKKEKIHCILVAHPRKVMTFLRKNDISGTGDIQNAADNIGIMHRVNQDFFKAGDEFFGKGVTAQYANYGNVLEWCKNRMFGVCDLLVGLDYEIESRRFQNFKGEDHRYGWETPPVQQSIDYEPPMPFKSPDDESAPF